MFTLIAAAALAAAPAQAAPTTDPHAQHMQMGQMDHSKMDHSKMDHSKMAQHGDGCCVKGPDGKMACAMSGKPAGTAHQGHSGQ